MSPSTTAYPVISLPINHSKNLVKLEAEVLSAVDQLTEVQRIWSLMGKEAGLTLVQRKFLDGSKGGYRLNKDVGFDFIGRHFLKRSDECLYRTLDVGFYYQFNFADLVGLDLVEQTFERRLLTGAQR